MATRMPAVFFGHGNPMNALQSNEWTEGWAAVGESVPRPRAILCVSAHWRLPATLVTAQERPRTIHDFGGFPRELYEVRCPAPGDPAPARRVRDLLAPVSVGLDDRWGLDHGAWSVLCHVFPRADIPVVQVSIDETQPAAFHYEVGKRLAPLRDEGCSSSGAATSSTTSTQRASRSASPSKASTGAQSQCSPSASAEAEVSTALRASARASRLRAVALS